MAHIPDGSGSRYGMFSLRFDNSNQAIVEKTVEAYNCLKDRNYNVLMVDEADPDFGMTTRRYLGKIITGHGCLLAMCTHHYAEVTECNFSSYVELDRCDRHGVEVIPFQMDDTFPPRPPSGPGTRDPAGNAPDLISKVFAPGIRIYDYRHKSGREMAEHISTLLRAPATAAATAGSNAAAATNAATAGTNAAAQCGAATAHFSSELTDMIKTTQDHFKNVDGDDGTKRNMALAQDALRELASYQSRRLTREELKHCLKLADKIRIQAAMRVNAPSRDTWKKTGFFAALPATDAIYDLLVDKLQ